MGRFFGDLPEKLRAKEVASEEVPGDAAQFDPRSNQKFLTNAVLKIQENFHDARGAIADAIHKGQPIAVEFYGSRHFTIEDAAANKELRAFIAELNSDFSEAAKKEKKPAYVAALDEMADGARGQRAVRIKITQQPSPPA